MVPHGTKGTGPMVHHETSVFEIPQNRNDTDTVSISTVCVYCICPLHIRRVGFAHHRVLQTSWRRLGWLQGSTRNGMYQGRAHSTGGSSQQGLLPEVYRTASTGEVSSPTTECSTSYGTKNPTTKQRPPIQDPGSIYSWWCSASSANGSRSHDCSSSAGLLDSYPALLLYLAGDALHQQPMGSRSHDCSSYVGCGGIPCSTLVSPNACLHRRRQAVAPRWPPYMVPESGFRPPQSAWYHL